ncbi:hypothetical protein IQ268_20645 [Oculatella sp. LEGE 06141]|uniref:hypothetical protein n=1 Tax=Oculatella sp. LEGE 06141 TaxID=1828648 RepID=UPI001882A732|nr:hypothetical protein [Oculatella sp. LEGE 06141]MBE9180972.1 hypothetical protein [Oculatella sp. LEGE 06141]
MGLAIASFTSILSQRIFGTSFGGLAERLNVGVDSSIPTWFSSFILFICTLLSGLIAFIKKTKRAPYVAHWTFLSFLFLYISVDEVATVRETIGRAVRTTVATTGIFYYNWVIVGIPFVLLVGFVYLKFLAHLPKKIRHLVVASGAIYVLGAIGMEMAASYVHSNRGAGTLTYAAITTVEELLEMTGVILLIYALLKYLALENVNGVQIYVQPENRVHH